MRNPDQESLDRLPQTEDSSERGYVRRSPETQDPLTYDDLGSDDDVDEDDIGDIADEGHGHRG